MIEKNAKCGGLPLRRSTFYEASSRRAFSRRQNPRGRAKLWTQFFSRPQVRQRRLPSSPAALWESSMGVRRKPARRVGDADLVAVDQATQPLVAEVC
jgi:hypothetical protein